MRVRIVRASACSDNSLNNANVLRKGERDEADFTSEKC